ncbi:hypothetical protein MSAN_02357200 [Mycena sanguinolenta]|uniref:Uncharacterized protein n=1 Tax=Mycena sanguinolenta TaxID=230812 RepID=A0A8H6X5J2_9AGAR|nr:hypothetical protein MSAN_02357200 [Mycena sanguinolenta]
MPKLKARAKVKNLGAYAVKRKGADTQQDDEEHTTKCLRVTSPAPEASEEESNWETEPLASGETMANNSDSDSEDEADIDVLEEDDVPHPKDHAAMVQWLKLSDEHLASLHTTTAPVKRGNYHTTKVEKGLSTRWEQELRKKEKERQAREDKQDKQKEPSDPAPEPEQPTDSVPMDIDEVLNEEPIHSIADSPTIDADKSMDPSPLPSDAPSNSTRRVTIEEVTDDEDEPEDQDEDELSVEPCQLSPEALAEEGLDDLPWDPSEDICNGNTPSRPQSIPLYPGAPPNPPPPSVRPLPPGAAAYFPGQQGFLMPNRAQRWKMPSPVPSNESVDAAIQNLQDILYPRRGTGRGHKKTNLDIVTTARLECMIRFLRYTKHPDMQGGLCIPKLLPLLAASLDRKPGSGRKIREWSISFCEDKKNLPTHKYGRFNSSILSDEDVAGDILLHLQSLGKFVSVKDIVRYVATPEFQAQ